MTPLDKTKKKLLAAIEVENDELAVRILEATHNFRRSANLTPTQILAGINPIDSAGARRAGEAAMGYVVQCVNAMMLAQ